MFVRVKNTPNSPRKSVQIVKSVRKGNKVSQKIIRHVGVAMDEDELEKLKQLAESIKIKLEADNQQLLFPPEELAKMKTRSEGLKEKITDKDYQVDIRNLSEEQRVINGIQDVYGSLFEELGFNRVIKNPARNKCSVEIFKNIVLARIANPLSKRASVDMLEEDFGVTLNLNSVYQMMDKLDDRAIEKINNVAYQNTSSLFQNKIDVIFFDCTTIYFETFEEDVLRQNGFSKDLKFNQPQVLLALMVTSDGLPVDYEIFAGDTYEGHTLIPALTKIREKYDIDKVVFIADSAMLSPDNIDMLKKLKEDGIFYIVGARLKNMTSALKDKILDKSNYRKIKKGYYVAEIPDGDRRIVVSYSEKRAKKDANDRKRAIAKLIKKLNRSASAKSHISNHRYKKYLKVEGISKVSLDGDKITSDARWDGLHGVITNSGLDPVEVLSRYNELWNVEASVISHQHCTGSFTNIVPAPFNYQ